MTEADPETRLALLEWRAAEQHEDFLEIRDEFRRFREEFTAQLRGLNRLMVGILVSVTTASILLVVNVVVMRG